MEGVTITGYDEPTRETLEVDLGKEDTITFTITHEELLDVQIRLDDVRVKALEEAIALWKEEKGYDI